VNQIYDKLREILSFPHPATYAEARPGEIRKVYLDPRKAGKVLGWKATVSFDEGLRRTVEWSRQRAAAGK
jgi:nucleoside-diphosphate-sugar epimerase